MILRQAQDEREGARAHAVSAETSTPRFILALDWACDPGKLRAWLAEAEPGSEVMYAAGLDLPRDAESVRLARAWAGERRVHLRQRKDPDDRRRTQFLIVKPRALSRPTATLPEGVPVHAVPRPDLKIMLDYLADLARRGRACPSLARIARDIGLRNRRQAQYRIDRLEAEGAIAVERRGPKLPLVIRITKTGKETKR